MKVAILNRFMPPDPSITGASAAELVAKLRERGTVDVLPIATQATYAGGTQAARSAPRVEALDGLRLSSWYSGKRPLLRLLASVWDGFRLAELATRKADLVITLTDPPMIGIWVGLWSSLRRKTWCEWTMDLYPEAFAAAGLVAESHVLIRVLKKVARSFPPHAYVCLGDEQAAFIRAHRAGRPTFVFPCGIPDGLPPATGLTNGGPVTLAYAGNLGEAHSLEFVVEVVKRADPQRFKVLLAVYGSRRQELERAIGKPAHVEWREHLDRRELARVDVHLVTLRPEWTHVCVPSKAVSAVCLGRPLLLSADSGGDTYQLLGRAAFFVPHRPQALEGEAVQAALDSIADPVQLRAKTEAARQLGVELCVLRQQALDQIASWVCSEAQVMASSVD